MATASRLFRVHVGLSRVVIIAFDALLLTHLSTAPPAAAGQLQMLCGPQATSSHLEKRAEPTLLPKEEVEEQS